jgi:hypothetical protein
MPVRFGELPQEYGRRRSVVVPLVAGFAAVGCAINQVGGDTALEAGRLVKWVVGPAA